MSYQDTSKWDYSRGTGSWDCPDCGKRAELFSPHGETLVVSAEKFGLRTFGNGAFGDPGKWLCAACSHAPDVEDRLAALRVAAALKGQA